MRNSVNPQGLPHQSRSAQTTPAQRSVPAHTPATIQKRIHAVVTKLLRTPELRATILAQGAVPVASTTEEFAVFLKAETAKWAKVIKDANIRAE